MDELKTYLPEEEFNTVCEEAEAACDDSRTLDDEEISSDLIGRVLDKGYSLMALTQMLMRYQMRIGRELYEQQKQENLQNVLRAMTGMDVRIVSIPTENPFEP